MPRQHTLTTALSLDDATGTSVSYDLVRIMEIVHNPGSSNYSARFECGRDNSGTWEQAGRHGSVKFYTGADYDTFRALNSAAASEKYMDKLEDQIYQDLVTDSMIGAGSQGDY